MSAARDVELAAIAWLALLGLLALLHAARDHHRRRKTPRA